MRRAAVYACLVSASFAVAWAAGQAAPRFQERLDAAAVDLLFHARHALLGRQAVSPRLVHVVLTDSSRRDLGLSDWDRTAYGEALEVLGQMGARTIACDVFFKDASFGRNDQSLLQAAHGRGVLFPVLVLPGSPADTASPHLPSSPETQASVLQRHLLRPPVTRQGSPPTAQSVVLPFAELAEAAAGLGHITCSPDPDQVNRRVPLLYRYSGGFIPALSLAAVMQFLDVAPGSLEVSFGDRLLLRGARAEDGTRRDISIPVDDQGRLAVNFAGPWDDSFPTIPLTVLLRAARDERGRASLRDLLNGAFVILSDVSTMGRDYGPGIFEAVYPLSGLHLSAANSILTGELLFPPRASQRVTAAAVLLAALWAVALLSNGRAFPALSAALYLLYAALCGASFIFLRHVPEMGLTSSAFFLAAMAVTAYRLGLVERVRAATCPVAQVPSGKGFYPPGSEGPGRSDTPGDGLLSEAAAPPPVVIHHPEAFSEIITESPVMRERFRLVETIAADDNPILITGESGVGKELIAGAIHRLSGRQGSFVSENVAGLDDAMFTDTLFGHHRGAFTDATIERPGLVELARGGTLFLDEIGDMPFSSQVKLLRFIELKEYRPLGSDRMQVSDARIVIATNVDLEQRLAEGKFREDLFFRLTHRVDIPPLRERLGDLPLLLDHFAGETARAQARRKPAVPAEIVTLLLSYHFPGNIRELKNMVDNAMSLGEAAALPAAFFRDYLGRKSAGENGRAARSGRLTFSEAIPTLRETEDLVIAEALQRTAGNQRLAARLLGLSPSALSRRLKKGARPS